MIARTPLSSEGPAGGEFVIDVELLALDLGTCTRCRGSLANVKAALALVKPALDVTGTSVRVHERLITTEEQARQHRLLISPTIRVGGGDIAPAIHQTYCESCTDLCGCDEGTQCRVWRYRGREYEEAPVGLIVEAVMRAASGRSSTGLPPAYDRVPDNLKAYFTGMSATESIASCCTPAVQDTCCESAEKAACCGPDEEGLCTCQ